VSTLIGSVKQGWLAGLKGPAESVTLSMSNLNGTKVAVPNGPPPMAWSPLGGGISFTHSHRQPCYTFRQQEEETQ